MPAKCLHFCKKCGRQGVWLLQRGSQTSKLCKQSNRKVQRATHLLPPSTTGHSSTVGTRPTFSSAIIAGLKRIDVDCPGRYNPVASPVIADAPRLRVRSPLKYCSREFTFEQDCRDGVGSRERSVVNVQRESCVSARSRY